MNWENKLSFINIFSESFENNIISKFIISKINNINSEKYEYSSVLLKPFTNPKGRQLSFVFKYKTKEITKNYTLTEAQQFLNENLGSGFLQADLFLETSSVHLLMTTSGNSKIIKKENVLKREVNTEHNKTKNHILDETPHPFLIKLGISTADGKIKNDKRDKFSQINKFLEFFAQAIKEAALKSDIQVLDMGSGKAYLTFAMYHYLQNIPGLNAEVQGIEFRKDMVNLCNTNAQSLAFTKLTFKESSIIDFKVPEKTNVLIALHACDTATDDALAKAIKSDIKLIMVAPCCHKQVRKEMNMPKNMQIFEQFGIVKERLAETLTDLLRTLILEAHGYQTKMFEFVTAGNTPKNMMITAVKKGITEKLKQQKLEQIKALKTQFGISRHHLEELIIGT